MRSSEKGYTLIELVVVLLIFTVVLAMAGASFNAVLSQSSRLAKSEESNIAGVIGLELLRHDLNQLGFGLPTEPATVSWFGEAAEGSASALLNDPPSGPPRPVAALERSAAGCLSATSDHPDDQGYTLVPCSDYLALKATNLGLAPAAQRWTYLNGVTPNAWRSPGDNPVDNDAVVVLGSSFAAGANSVALVPTLAGSFYYQFNSASAFANLSSQAFPLAGIYGVGTGTLRMPFNRADYFVARPPAAAQMSAGCAPGTGVLYRAVVNQGDGRLTYYPLLDCVASMQVVFGWQTDGNGTRTWSNADGSTALGLASDLTQALLPAANSSSSAAATNIRNNLKVVKVYLLAQSGGLDPGYTSPSPIQVGMQPGENDRSEGSFSTNSATYSYDINAAGWRHYRWKVYRIIVAPKNLPANQ